MRHCATRHVVTPSLLLLLLAIYLLKLSLYIRLPYYSHQEYFWISRAGLTQSCQGRLGQILQGYHRILVVYRRAFATWPRLPVPQLELGPFHHRRAVSATDLDPSMPDRTRISTRTWAGILVTHGVYYENSCYPVVLGLEGSVKTWPRKWVTPVSLEIETKKSTAPLPFPPSLVLISPALNMARLSPLAHTKYTNTYNTHIHYPRVVRPCVTGGSPALRRHTIINADRCSLLII